MKVPKEIKDYQEKLMAGMSIRQLIFFVLTLVVSIGGTAYCVAVLGMSVDAAGYVIIPLCVPLVAFGWVRKNGMPLEKYVKVVLNYHLKTGIRSYQTKEKVGMNECTKKPSKKRKEYTQRQPDARG